MAGSGWEMLGEAIAGPDREKAFQEGRLLTAQTEGALGLARKRQLENVAAAEQQRQMARFQDLLANQGVDPDPNQLLGAVVGAGVGTDYAAATQGNLRRQEQGFRDTVANPATTNSVRQANLAAISGKPFSPLAPIGAGGVTDITADSPEVTMTPLGDSLADENYAQAALFDAKRSNPELFRAPSTTAPGGIRAPTNYRLNPDYDPSLPEGPDNLAVLPLTGTKADPNTPQPMGSMEARFFNRIVGSANAVMNDLRTLVSMPAGASVGYLGTGVGATPGVSIFDATSGNLKSALSSEEVDNYNVLLGGMNRALQLIESQGLAGSNALLASYDSLVLRPTDNVGQKMIKLAQMRQTVESGLEPQLYNPRVPPEQKQLLQKIIVQLRQNVPFDTLDVLALSKNPGKTLAQVMNEQKGPQIPVDGRGAATTGGGIPTVPGAAAPGAQATGTLPETNSRGWQLMEDAEGNLAYVGPNGEIEEVQ